MRCDRLWALSGQIPDVEIIVPFDGVQTIVGGWEILVLL